MTLPAQVAVHPHLPLVVSAHEDGYVRFFDLTSGAPPRTHQPAVAYAPTRMRACGAGKCVDSVKAHQDAATCVAIDPTGLFLATGGHDTSIRVWSIGQRRCLQEEKVRVRCPTLPPRCPPHAAPSRCPPPPRRCIGASTTRACTAWCTTNVAAAWSLPARTPLCGCLLEQASRRVRLFSSVAGTSSLVVPRHCTALHHSCLHCASAHTLKCPVPRHPPLCFAWLPASRA